MKPKVVTFDAAETLVRVKWSPGGFALSCASAVGLDLGDEERGVYERSLRSRWGEYQQINTTRDEFKCDQFWHRLTEDWLETIGQPRSLAPAMIEAAPGLLYGTDLFTLFDDVLPTLDALDAAGTRLGVISNWDYSLHRVLRSLGIHDRLEHVVASLEEGVEKPDSRLFDLTLERFGVAADEAVHVGDNPLDDFRGAQEAGMYAFLIDRSRPETRGAILAALSDLPALLAAS